MTTRNPWPFSKPKPTRATRSRQPTKRELREQLQNADRRAERAVDRLERATPGTAAYEEAVRLGRLAQRHLTEVEARAHRLYGIEPESKGLLATILRRPSRAERHASRTGLGELLFGVSQREQARRSTQRAATTRRTAKTRPFTPVSESRKPHTTPRTVASGDGNDYEELRKRAEDGTLRGDALRDFINRYGATRKGKK